MNENGILNTENVTNFDEVSKKFFVHYGAEKKKKNITLRLTTNTKYLQVR